MSEEIHEGTAGLYRYDPTWEEVVVLNDGTHARLRLVRPEDKDLLRAGWQRLSPESRHRRFLTGKSSLSGRELGYLTEMDNLGHLAIGASRDRDGTVEGIGIARFIRLDDRADAAEAAIAVTDDAQRVGLGRCLLSRLAAAAWERGVRRFTGEVLVTNTAMRHLLQDIAPSSTERTEGTTVSIDVPLQDMVAATGPTGAAEPVTEPAPAGGLLYRLLRLAGQRVLAARNSVLRRPHLHVPGRLVRRARPYPLDSDAAAPALVPPQGGLLLRRYTAHCTARAAPLDVLDPRCSVDNLHQLPPSLPPPSKSRSA